MRQYSALALAAFALCALAPAAAQEVYKWKDARGVTHYSEKPPASGRYTTQAAVRDPATPATSASTTSASGTAASTTTSGASTAAPAAAAPVDRRCDSARRNLAVLQSPASVQQDRDGDGKPDATLSNAERASQQELARATLKAYNCTETAGAAG